MLCNLAEDMLSNWAEARMVVHSMKMKIVEIDTQLTELEKNFSWKGIASISSLNIHKAGAEAQGGGASGGASGSEMGRHAITSLGGSGSSSKSP